MDEFEYLYVFWKPGEMTIRRRRLAEGEWGTWGSRAVWRISSVRANDTHEAMFPLELVARLVRLFTDPGDTVLDCFMGSGTTGEACAALERGFVGIEKCGEYFRLAERRLREKVYAS